MNANFKSEDFMTVTEARLINRRNTLAEDANLLISLIMKDGCEYRCKTLAKMLNKAKNTRKYTYTYIAKIMKVAMRAGVVKRIEKDGKPIEIEDWLQDEIVIDGRTYFSQGYWGTRTITPKIAYYSLA